ncbi:DUF3426 domain-containing protein [Pseudodesulfovibrio indicus]|uniref:Zn finger-like uncharacterized protein n=1 Tax=Pseudodesulfovibrio indicus TaxID=1716143 RepID=A0A140D9N9_9BACT|nr:DUF3426 domain-containing protein [Pseudodesulfovibrio indicus]AMK09906.1 hypothetical protein AWY79_01655 [Pseudodesulfovibrio indicus]TDT87413.1 putative Zn finger-like uncharacterized protein [Pseudodesulfovibrio indicus]
MIVTCPNCETSYNLPDEKIPAGGAKVKCSKCAHVFKAELPPATPEEEVEALLEDESTDMDTRAGDEFDETFEDVAAAGVGGETAEDAVAEEPAEPPVPDPADEVVEEMPDMDDLFDESEEAPEPEEGPRAGAAPQAGDEAEEDLFADLGSDGDEPGENLFADSGDEDDGDLFEDSDDAEADDVDSIFADDERAESGLGGTLELDEEPAKGGRKPLGCLIILLVLAVAVGAAVYFKAWTYAGIDLGDMLKNVPFVGQLFMEETGGADEAAPGESPAERVRKIELKNVKQYYVANEKTGNLFVVEGKAVNKFSKPKERIKVEVILYDEANNVLTSQSFLCGNVLSQFQLQVQTEKEITDGLASDVGILSNNTFIRPGSSTPFMAVFFQPPAGVKEFMVKVVDVGDPE